MIRNRWLELHEVPLERREATVTGGQAEDIKGRWLDHDGTTLPFRLEGRDWTGKIDWEGGKIFRVSGWQSGFSGGRTEIGAWYRVQLDLDSYVQYFNNPGRDSEPSRAAPERRQRRHSRSQVKYWYIKRVSDLQAAGMTSSREEDERAAEAKFGAGVRGQLRELRQTYAPAEWRKPGPK